MIIAMLAITAVLIGVFLGTRFNVLVLVPAIVIGMATSVGVSLTQGDQVWWVIVLVAFLTNTALQVGYLAGAIIGHAMAERSEKLGSELTTTAQRFPTQA
jgi:hypothetical protein